MTQETPPGADALDLAAADILSSAGDTALLEALVRSAVTTIGVCSAAGITVEHHGRPRTEAASDPSVHEIDQLQYARDSGPCLDAMRGTELVVDAPNIGVDERWPKFGPQAAERGVRSVLAHQLHVGSERLGSLNLYGATPDGFGEDDRRVSAVLAALASLAVQGFRHQRDAIGLREALRSRDIIGQAKGILMVREGIGEDAAFDRLRVESQSQNIKLREVAEQVVQGHPLTGGGP